MPTNHKSQEPSDAPPDFQIYLDDLLLDTEQPNSLANNHSPALMPPIPAISTSHTTATHEYAMDIPVDLWQLLKITAPYRGIKAWILDAIREKLGQPHLPSLITAAKALLRIADQLLLTADDPPANADQALSDLQHALKHFD